MRLHEISPELRHDLESASVPEPVLKRHGYDLLGSGIDAAVVRQGDQPFVTKVFRSSSPYADYVSYCRGHRSNPHVPVFFTQRQANAMSGISGGHRSMVIEPAGRFSVVYMEELEPVSYQGLMALFRPEIYAMYLIGTKHGMRCFRHEADSAIRKDIIKKLGIKPDYVENIKELADNSEGWYELWAVLGHAPDDAWLGLCHDLVAIAKQSRGRIVLDLNEDNVMLRDGSTLVITDPYA